MIEIVDDLRHRDPFVPFRIVMMSGHAYEVANPDLVVPQKTQIVVFVPKSDKYLVLRLNQIAAIEVLEPAS